MKNTADVLIRLNNIKKSFDGQSVLNGISFNIKKNEFVTLLGPSGCGKTTTLRILGGFEQPDSGEVYFGDKIMNDVPPYKRKVNTVFQKYALFPHLNVGDNVAFGLKIKKMPNKEIKKKVSEVLKLVGLAGYEKRWPDSLSGGQQQRVAIARAIVNDPDILLLDEPLGALDLKMRKEMQSELKRIQQQVGITFVFVTHDQEEALTMSDVIVVMNNGDIQQIGTPEDIYNEPANPFVADFIGESNILQGVMKKDYLVNFFERDFECVDKGFSENENIWVVVRPEDIKVVPPQDGMLTGVVESVVFMGVHYEMKVVSKGFTWLVHSTLYEPVGTEVGMDIFPNDIHIMKKED